MSKIQMDPLVEAQSPCGTLLHELQIIWDEIGETSAEKDRLLFELEQECLDVYRRKVDMANQCKARLQQTIADSEAELAAICSAMGDRPIHIKQFDPAAGGLKEALKNVIPLIDEKRKRKIERKNQFLEVLEQIQGLVSELSINFDSISPKPILDESDLTLRRLEELHKQLHALKAEKSDRLKQVHDHLNTLDSLCSVLGFDFGQTVSEIHFTLGDSEMPNDISNITIEKLAILIQKLREVKLQRMQMLQDFATTMLELWNLMDTPIEEQQNFQSVTCNIAASENEVTEPNTLSLDFINCVQAEVNRLEALKASKMKELVLKKRMELHEICRKTHLIPEGDNEVEQAIEAIDCGAVDPVWVLEQIELQISKVREESLDRKELLEKVEKWLAACEEECWLEEYNRDDNRYNAGRGAHLALKRAEKARALVNKLPAMVEALASKIIAWEQERGAGFTYDGMRLLTMLEDYTLLQQEKEEERRRLRDQKKLQGQLIAEQEALYGSKPSPSKTQMVKKAPRMSTGGGASSRRLSLGGAMIQTPKPNHPTKATPQSRLVGKMDRLQQSDRLLHHQDNALTGLSAGRRGLDVAGLPSKKHSFESPMNRQPFSPITPAVPTQSNLTNLMDDAATRETVQKTVPSSFSTPVKTVSFIDEENRTPKTMQIPTHATPSTVCIPMQTATTPAPTSLASRMNSVKEIVMPEEIEYSFEERRAGFLLRQMMVVQS